MISQFRRLITLLKAGQNSGGVGGGNAIVEGRWQKRQTGTFLFGLFYMLNCKCQSHILHAKTTQFLLPLKH